MSEPLVLVIDDESDTIDYIRAACARYGKRVIGASNGGDGLALARSAQPAVILIDLLLPGMSGLEICRQLCADPTTARIPKAVLSASISVEAQLAATAAGAVRYSPKPIGVKPLIALIDELLALAPLPPA
jgi:CheY-like chemotaxis protein